MIRQATLRRFEPLAMQFAQPVFPEYAAVLRLMRLHHQYRERDGSDQHTDSPKCNPQSFFVSGLYQPPDVLRRAQTGRQALSPATGTVATHGIASRGS